MIIRMNVVIIIIILRSSLYYEIMMIIKKYLRVKRQNLKVPEYEHINNYVQLI